jgi:hypothetical protein
MTQGETRSEFAEADKLTVCGIATFHNAAADL